jgi:ABC-2 type transport system permease protein
MQNGEPMKAMIIKEFRQLRRDHRTLGMLFVLPIVLLVIFGYAARFEVATVDTAVIGKDAATFSKSLPALFRVVRIDSVSDPQHAEALLRSGSAEAVFIADGTSRQLLVDGSNLFSANAASAVAARSSVPTRVLFNEHLRTAVVMVPALIGLILAFIGILVTSLGVVREREAGTLAQLSVTPLKSRDVIVGKIVPYFVVAAVDMVAIATIGTLLFDVPFAGSVLTFSLGAGLFLLVTLGLGLFISTVSTTQGQAIQLSIMVLLPQVLLSGMIFPLKSMPPIIRAVGYALPLTHFVTFARAVMIKGTGLADLWVPVAALAGIGAVIFVGSLAKFRRELTPGGRGGAREIAALELPPEDVSGGTASDGRGTGTGTVYAVA